MESRHLRKPQSHLSLLGEGGPIHLFILPAWLLQTIMFVTPEPREKIKYISNVSLILGLGWGVIWWKRQLQDRISFFWHIFFSPPFFLCSLPLSICVCVFFFRFFSIMWKWKSLSRVQLYVTPWTIQSMEFSRPESVYSYQCYTVGPCLSTLYISSIQSLSHVWLFVIPWTAAHQAFLSITKSWSLLKLMSIESVMPSNHLILCCTLLLLPSIFPSIGVFSSESVLHIRCPKYWSFSFSISPPNEYWGLISSRMDWLDLPPVQGTLKSLLQHHTSKASVLQRSAFFIVQLSHPYMTTGKTIALTRQTIVGNVSAFQYAV